MPCYEPIQGWLSKERNASGKRSIVFNAKDGFRDRPVTIPCGRCWGCRLEKSKQWAMRCVHEASLHEENCFITLTYDEENLPYDGSLDKKHFQDFMKRLRKKLDGRKIRYFHCGEYGEKFSRPHYHACLFGIDFHDKTLLTEKGGNRLYVSELLTETWGKGHCTIGELTFESAAYVARYVTKKVDGKKKSDGHYIAVLEETGEITELEPEYATMSRRPGLGAKWFEKYKTDLYPKDFVTIRGVKMKPAPYYDALMEEENPELMRQIKLKRLKAQHEMKGENTTARLMVRKEVKQAASQQIRRTYEND
jgi:hypothetical protein